MLLPADFSSFILVLALIGFLVKDAFYLPRRLFFHELYDIKDSTEKVFSNVAVVVLIVCVLWYSFMNSIATNPEPFNIFASSVDGLVQNLTYSGALTTEEVGSMNKAVIQGSISLSFISILYLISFIAIFSIGFVWEVVNKSAVCLTLKGEKRLYKRIVFESSDLIYLQKHQNLAEWEALKKEDITSIESTIADSLFQKSLSRVYHRIMKK
ncbi:hypothetical protein [Methanolobus profundi]|uniref:Uncharacterized protein n=1 Tax=Methanolobus profundi TaxID=487685 RepID=A0A1I4SU24_9EURY|nr:hypothetical protein [Methanolobus profundi]SFM67879.1 hypothetical protein SAMN04488696_2010 [Methanolobus profundi]